MYFMFQLLFIMISSFTLFAENLCVADSASFFPPSKRFLECRGDDYLERVFDENERLIPLKGLLDEAVDNEQLGFFGYNGCCSDFRIYQDLIRIGIEEILGIHVRNDFHFLRIPGDSRYTHNTPAEIFENYRSDIDDLREEASSQLLSLQLAMYRGCASDNGSCSIGFFADNYAINTVDYAKQLELFFDMLGLNTNQTAEAFEIGRKLLPVEYGALLQFFDMSHTLADGAPYDFVDMFAYPSHTGGKNIETKKKISNYIGKGKQFPQIRLVISNRHVLNPYSPLTIKRYDNLDEKIVKQYEEAIRNFYKAQTVNEEKRALYKSLLLSQWSS